MKTELYRLCGILAIIFIIILAMEVRRCHDKLNLQKRDLDWYQTNYISKQGGTTFWKPSNGVSINYHLRSFDAGKNWYATHNTTNDETIIDGPVETVYPGLMKVLQDWDNLETYVKKHGPITLSNPSDEKILKQNGFDFIRTTN